MSSFPTFKIAVICVIYLSIFTSGSTSQEPVCVKNTIIGCPIVEGVQKICSCTRACSNCCSCRCPEDYEPLSADMNLCSIKATRLGQHCQHTASAWISCSKIPESHCLEVEMDDERKQKQCVCKSNRYPSNNMKRCLAVPTKLGQPCSNEIHCPASIQHSVCLEINPEGDYECGCAQGYFPDTTKTKCIPAPKRIGDECSADSKCTNIPASDCMAGNTCQCWSKYLPNSDSSSCLATKIGMNCPAKSTCDLLKGSKCYGTSEASICICPWNIPNVELTKCFGFN